MFLEYLNDAMRVNHEQRAQLKGSTVRRQDAALVLQNGEERSKSASSEYRSNSYELETKVAAMFSGTIPIGDIAVKGIVKFATYLPTSVLERMVQLPINVPSWMFKKEVVVPFLRLSCKHHFAALPYSILGLPLTRPCLR